MGFISAGIVSLLTLTSGLPEVMWLGDPAGPGSALSQGMGGTGFMEVSALGALHNPSLLALLDEGVHAGISGGADISVEKRTRRVYSQFENSIGESETAFNRGVSIFPGGAAAAVRGAFGLPATVGLAAGYRVPASFGYSYGRVVRDDAYVRTGEESLEVSGTVSEFVLAAAFMPSEAFSFGLSGSYLTGTRDARWEVTHVDPSLDGTLTNVKESMSGVSAGVSVMFTPHRRIFVSGSLEYPMPLSISPAVSGDSPGWDVMSDVDHDLDRPLKVNLGAMYFPGNRLRSRAVGGFYWSADNSLEFLGGSLGLKNAWGVSAGVENTLPGGPRARFGFGYHRSPISASLDRMSFTAGMGFSVSGWDLDLGAGFSPVRWRQTEVAGLPSFVPGDSLTVEETGTRLTVSVSRAFGR